MVIYRSQKSKQKDYSRSAYFADEPRGAHLGLCWCQLLYHSNSFRVACIDCCATRTSTEHLTCWRVLRMRVGILKFIITSHSFYSHDNPHWVGLKLTITPFLVVRLFTKAQLPCMPKFTVNYTDWNRPISNAHLLITATTTSSLRIYQSYICPVTSKS